MYIPTSEYTAVIFCMYSVGGTTCLASLMMLFCQLWGHQQGAALLWCFAPLTLVHLWVVTQRWGCLLSAPLQLALGSLFLPLFTEEGHLLAPNAPLLCLFSNNDFNRSLCCWLWNFELISIGFGPHLRRCQNCKHVFCASRTQTKPSSVLRRTVRSEII